MGAIKAVTHREILIMNENHMNDLRTLIAQIEPGWTVKTTNHDYIASSGINTVTEVTATKLLTKLGKPVTNQGRRFTTSYFTWPTEGDDFEVSGMTLRTYRKSYGSRVIALTLTFAPPSEC